MKIRWTEHSLRFRITPTELESLQDGQPVREELALPGGTRWRAALQTGTGETHLTADGPEVTLHLCVRDRDRLAAPGAEGVYFQDETLPLRFLVEKDFPCVHPRASHALEPPTEAFVPPPEFEERKGVEG